MMKTYAVASAATSAIDGPINPMMISENSPLAISAVPARNCPRRATPSRRAAKIPVATLVAAATVARARAAGIIDDLLDPGDTLFGADHNQDILRPQHLSRPRRGEHLLVAHDRDDRRTGAAAGLGVAQRVVHEWALRRDADLTRLEPGHPVGQLGEPFGDPRRAENLSHGLSLFVGEAEDRPGLVRVVTGIQDDVEIAAAPRDDADPVTFVAGELVSKADAGQQHLLDIHTVNP